MLRRLSVILSVPALVALATALPALAGPATSGFDLIVADSFYVFCGPANSGFSHASDVGLVVNRGPADIVAADLAGATIAVASSDPQVQAMPFILNEGVVAPIQPNEAVGWATEFSPLLPLISPQETYRSTEPIWFYGLAMGYPVGYEGTVAFDVTVTIGTEVARYTFITIIQQYVESSIWPPHAIRVSSVPLATTARPSSWGALKKLYR